MSPFLSLRLIFRNLPATRITPRVGSVGQTKEIFRFYYLPPGCQVVGQSQDFVEISVALGGRQSPLGPGPIVNNTCKPP